MKRLIIWAAALAMAFEALAAIPFGNVRTTPRRTVRLLAASNGADAGFDCFIGCTGEPIQGLGVKVSAGTEISFDFDCTEEFKPLSWTLNGVEMPLPAVNPDGRSMTFKFTCLVNETHVYIVCRRPIYVDAAAGQDVTNPSNEVSRGYSPDRPFKSIQFGADIALADAEVRVAGGTYAPFSLTNSHVRIVHTNLADRAVIDAGGKSRCAEFLVCYSNGTERVVESSATNGLLRGFTLRNGRADVGLGGREAGSGGGVRGGLIVNCEVTACTADADGGGIYAALVRSSLIHGCSARVGGGAALSSLVNCTVAANTATETGGGLDHSCATNSVISANSVNGNPNDLDAASRTRYSVSGRVSFTSLSDFHLKRPSGALTEGLAKVLRADETDLDGKPYHVPGQTAGKLLLGCYQAAEELHVPDTGLRINGLPFSDPECPIADWHPATSTVVLFEGEFTVSGTATNACTLAGVDKLKTRVRFEPVASGFAISNLTVVGGSASVTAMNSVEVLGGNVSPQVGGDVSGITGWDKPLHEVRFTAEGWNPGGEFVLTGLHDYDTTGLVPADNGTVSLWLPAVRKWTCLTYGAADDLHRLCYRMAADGSVTVIRESDLGTFAINGETVFDALMTPNPVWTYDAVGNRVSISMSGNYVCTGECTSRLGLNLDANAKVTLSNVVLDCTSAYGRSAIELGEHVTATLLLDGINTLHGAGPCGCGVFVPAGASLTVTNAASAETAVLNAKGESFGAGLGSGVSDGCGRIAIRGGTVNATGGVAAPGIGICDCNNGFFERIEISGGFVRARSGAVDYGTTSSPAIGCGSMGTGGEILISGGFVDVAEGADAAPIGWGKVRNGGQMRVVISGGTVTAGGSGKMICGPLQDDKEANSTYLITGGSVFADAMSAHPAPSNGVAAVRRVMARIPEDWPAEAAVEVVGLPDYGTHDIRAIGGRVYLWLPEGAGRLSLVCREPGDSSGKTAYYGFASTGACEAQSIPEPLPRGLTVNGFDIVWGRGRGWALTEDGEELDLFGPGPYTLSGSATNVSVVVQSNATVALSGVVLDCRSAFGPSAIELGERVTATLLIDGTNTLYGGGSSGCGVLVPEGSSLTVTNAAQAETAVLNAEGGGPGLGAGDRWCGSIAIRGGTVNATGGTGASGIGTGLHGGGFERIEISGGFVRARSSGDASSAIGCSTYDGSGGEILISGGYVDVAAGTDASPIGWGRERRASGGGRMRVVISGGTVAAGGSEMMICGPLRDEKERDSTYLITGGSVFADAVSVHPAPSNGGAAVRRVMVRIPEDWPAEAAVEVRGLADYGTRDVRAIGGRVYLWLPEGAGNLSLVCREPGDSSGKTASYSFASTGACEAQPFIGGLAVNGLDITQKSGPGWAMTEDGEELDLFGPGPYTLSGSATNVSVVVQSNATVTLSGVVLDCRSAFGPSAIVLGERVTATLLLSGENTLHGGNSGSCGVLVPEGSSLTVTNAAQAETAVLNAEGGGPGLGAGDRSCGSIAIRGGTVNATCRLSAPGIGVGDGDGFFERIEISGGFVRARSSGDASSAIGCASYGFGGEILISGGYVDVAAGTDAAPIGWGLERKAGGEGRMRVVISGGTVAAGGSEMMICGPLQDYKERDSTYLITGGSVFADAVSVHPVPSNGDAAVRRVAVTLPEDWPAESAVEVVGLPDYGTRDVRAIGGRVYLWLPEGDGKLSLVCREPGDSSGMVASYSFASTGACEAQPLTVELTVNGLAITRKSGPGWALTEAGDELDLFGPGPFVLAGESTDRLHVCVNADAEVTLSNLTLSVGGEWESAFTIASDVSAKVFLFGTNRLESTKRSSSEYHGGGAGIRVPKTATVSISNAPGVPDDAAVLYVNGGDAAAAIGETSRDRQRWDCGTVWIRGGTVFAVGGTYSAAIGSAYFGACGRIVISGGRVDARTRSNNNASAIGCGENGYGGSVEVFGGRIVAKGAYLASPIGWGEYRIMNETDVVSEMEVLISGGAIDVSESESGMVWPRGGGGDGEAHSKFTITGGSLRFLKTARPQPTDGYDPVRRVEVDVRGIAEDGEQVTIEGLEGYGLKDVVPIDGKLYLWLPDGWHPFTCNGVPLAVFVSGDRILVDRPENLAGSGLTVNGQRLTDPHAAPWGFDGTNVCLKGAGRFVISGSATNLRVVAMADCSVVMSNLVLTVPNRTADNWYWSAFAVSNAANVDLTFEGTNNLLAVRDYPDAGPTPGAGVLVARDSTLRILNGTAMFSSVRGYCGPGRDDFGRLDILGGSLDLEDGGLLEIVPSNGVSRVRRVTIPLPPGTPADEPVVLTGFGDYGVRDLYPSANDTLNVWLPEREYVVGVAGRYYRIAEANDCIAEPIVTGFTVNGRECTFGSGPGWRYSADYEELSLDCTTDYTLSCTNLGYGLDIVIAQDKAAMIVGGTLDWDRSIDGALRICGGNMRLAPSAFTVPPSNGAGERVYPVTVNLTDGFSDDVALELSEMTRDGAAYGYGCADTRPIDGTLTIWLPRGGYRFAVNGIPYAVTVEGRAAAAEPLGIGLRVDGYDVSEPGHPAGWTWNGYTRTLDMTERHRLDGTNPVVAVTLASGTVNGGTARISVARPGVRITGGSLKIGNAASVALSNDYERVHCVPVPVPYGVRDGDEVRISGGVPYGSDGIVAMDGHVYLWLPGVTNVFVVNGIPMISTVTDGKTEVSYFEMGLTVDGVDVGRGVGNGWTWDAATGELTITGKDGGAPYLLSGGEALESTHMQVTADARLVMSNFLLNASMGERSALTVAKGCTATLSFPGPSRLFGAAGRSALGGEGRVVIEGGTAFLSGDADGEAVSECAWEINGGSIGIGPLDTLPVRPVNLESQEVYLVKVELPGRKTRGDPLVFDRGDIPAYYNLEGIRPSEAQDVSLWLPRTQPTNVYEFAIDGDRYRAVLTGEGSSVTPLYDRIGVSVNGIDCGLLHDAGWTYDPVTGVLALDGGVKNYVVTGSNETGLVRIRAAATAAGGRINLVASDLVLTTVSDGESPVDVVPGTVLVISVDGEARFAAASGAAGIHVPPGAALNATYLLLGARTISDVLVASGGALAAGIGGNAGEGAGSVIVDGVNVEAHGGVRAAAIGGGNRGAGGDVEIRRGEILAYGGDGRDGDGLGGAGIGGGYLGAGGRTVVSGGFCEIFAGENGAAIGGGAGGDGGIVDIRGGTVFPHLRHPEPFAQDVAAIGGGSGGRAGSNAFAGGSVVVTNALGETAADLVRDAPTSALGAAVAGIVLAVPPESSVSDHTPVKIVGLGDYGVDDIYPVGGKLYLWLPDNAEGEHYIFTVNDVGYDLVVRNGKAEYLEYLVSGVTVNGVDCCFTNNPAWLWTPANSNLTVSGGGTYVVSGEASRSNVRVVAAGGSTVVLSNFIAAAAFDEPVAVAAGQEAKFVFAGSNDCFRALGGAGRATVERGNVVLGAIGGTVTKVVVAGGNVICEDEKSCERDCMANPDGRRVWPVTVDLPAGCTNALPVAFEGLPPYYDATGIRDIGGRVCVWLPEGQWDLSVIGTALAGDGTATNLVTNLTAVVTDEGAIIGELASVSVPDDEGGTVEVPVPWVIAHMRPAATPSISAMRNYLNGPSRNDGIPVWQSYVAGLDPNDPAQTFKAVIECRDGCFVVRPSLVVPDRIYWVIASPDLSFDPNRIVVYPLPASGKVEFPADRVNMFFKVKVGFE